MAKKSRSRGRGSSRSDRSYQQTVRNLGPHRELQASPQPGNTFAHLDSVGEEGAGEMNPHLMERFGSSRAADTAYLNLDRVPISAPSRINNDIREYFDNAKLPLTSSAWIRKPEVPTPSELLPGPTSFTTGEQIIDITEEIRPNKVEGAYESNEDYLQIQYELLREDAIRPLREAIEHVRHSPWLDESEYPDGSSVGIYEPVYITSTVFSPRGLATRVTFSLSRVKKYVRWDQSKRLITGTLVALSPANDAFQNKCVLATVAARPLSALDQNPPEIDLFFARPEDIEIDPMKKWVMVENRGSFFEASRHTLLALQHIMREPFPLSEQIVRAEKAIEPPSYIQKNPYLDMSSLVTMEESEDFENVNILQEWPSSTSHGLDKSQSKALKRILTNRLAIIQGPPGTGKTYVSVVALKILLANLRKDDSPIVVTCQTNHALDQLLRHVAEFEPNFIRLGGRSKDKDKVKKRTLYEVRSNMPHHKTPGGLKSQAIIQMKKLTSAMQNLLGPLEANKPPLCHRLLVKLGLITGDQADSLEMETQFAMGVSHDDPGIYMEQWLGKCLAECRRPIQPDDFGMEFEEEDFEVERLKELEAEAVAQDDEDIEALKGPVTLLCDNYTGRGGSSKTDDEIRDLLKKTQDLTTIPVASRGAIYNYFQRQTKRIILVEFRKYAKQYENAVLQRKVGQWEQDLKVLKDQRLIGLTTTGLSKYRGLIAALRPQVVLVEEAGETLEAPVTAACIPSLEHLVLVGDHQQLRPHCQVRQFEEQPYNFNLSLFERLVVNDIGFDTLTRQRRMIPEIRRLLEPIYGDTLKDHPNVKDIHNRPSVEGMGGNNSFFFTHEWLETMDANMSALNEKEADMIVGFVDYLVLNSVDPRQITILTFYNGQRKAIGKKLRQHPNLRGYPVFNLVTVDSYQGEENDIVLLSLVRSNRKHKIGFLSVDNRVCVALSRARRGFYIFGNAEMLACESGTWAAVVDIMYGKGKSKVDVGQKHRVGYQFPLQCAQHGRKIWIEDPDDWQYINGGCDKRCGCLLSCGHTCMLRCHPFDNSRINCTQKCSRRVDPCGHPCIAMCCDPCKCQVCDRRNNGVKALVKPRPTHSANPFRSQPRTFNDTTSQMPQMPQAPASRTYQGSSRITEGSGSNREAWQEYADRGVKLDDAHMLQKRKEEDARFYGTGSKGVNGLSTNLIETSPVQGQSSKTLNLLVDLDIEAGPSSLPQPRFKYQELYSFVAGGTEDKKPVFDLLD